MCKDWGGKYANALVKQYSEGMTRVPRHSVSDLWPWPWIDWPLTPILKSSSKTHFKKPQNLCAIMTSPILLPNPGQWPFFCYATNLNTQEHCFVAVLLWKFGNAVWYENCTSRPSHLRLTYFNLVFISSTMHRTASNEKFWGFRSQVTAGDMQKNAGKLCCHLVDVLELILQNSFNGPQWGNFLLSRNWKNKKHKILDIHLKDINAGFGCLKSQKIKKFKTRGMLHIKSI